jgi:ATP-dependent Clp endopeptidase proteolytic subunit ClpP
MLDFGIRGFRAALEADTLSLLVFGPLGEGQGEHAIVAANVVQQIQDFRGTAIDVYINSPGGIVFEGLAIYNALRRHEARTTIYIDGICASAATIVAMAGDRIIAADNATLMVHAVYNTVRGDAADMRKEAEVLDQLTDTLVNLYMQRTGRSRQEVAGWVAEETWFTAAEALRLGLVDEVAAASRAVAQWDCAAFGIRPPNSGLGARDSGLAIAELRREVAALRGDLAALHMARGDPVVGAVLVGLGESFATWVDDFRQAAIEALQTDPALRSAAVEFKADFEAPDEDEPDPSGIAGERDLASSAGELDLAALLQRVRRVPQ